MAYKSADIELRHVIICKIRSKGVIQEWKKRFRFWRSSSVIPMVQSAFLNCVCYYFLFQFHNKSFNISGRNQSYQFIFEKGYRFFFDKTISSYSTGSFVIETSLNSSLHPM